jgi:hypothetical protein
MAHLDPTKTGKAACMGDIGTHAAQLAEYVSGVEDHAFVR